MRDKACMEAASCGTATSKYERSMECYVVRILTIMRGCTCSSGDPNAFSDKLLPVEKCVFSSQVYSTASNVRTS